MVTIAVSGQPSPGKRIPEELEWTLTLFFFFFLFPAKLVVGWVWRRGQSFSNRAFWFWWYIAWMPQIAVILTYIRVLYLENSPRGKAP
jgi:hypothetical protein